MAAITDLATASSVSSSNYLVINQSGTDRKVTADKFAIAAGANTFSATPQTVTSSSNLALELIRTGTTNVALKFTDSAGSITVNGGGNGLVATSTINTILELNRSSGSYAALKLTDTGGNITLNGGGSGFLVSSLSGTGTVALEATSIGVVQRTTSDARLKCNVASVEPTEALELALRLRPVRYNWRDTEARGTQRELGLIAQEVAPVVPEVVTQADHDGMLGIDYPKLTAVLIGAVQELAAQVTALQASQAR